MTPVRNQTSTVSDVDVDADAERVQLRPRPRATCTSTSNCDVMLKVPNHSSGDVTHDAPRVNQAFNSPRKINSLNGPIAAL